MRSRVWSVSRVIRELNTLLDQGFNRIQVEGELTNLTISGRGHIYFSLRDPAAALDCVMWSSRAERLRFQAEDGLAVLALGSLTVYPQRGRLQLVVDSLEPEGMGALQLAFEQLKKRLAGEGLFATERKRPLPVLAQRVGIVTSLGGAALRDMLKVLNRCPLIAVVVAHAEVQGQGSALQIARSLHRLGASGLVDVVIVGRGGGSLEDLWAFNEECVARAIVECPVPVISGVGHQVDFTIADFSADVRAATPTQAAELVVAQLEKQVRRLDEASHRLVRDLKRHLQLARTRLAGLEGSSGLAAVPQRVRLLAARLARAEQLGPRLQQLLRHSQARLRAAETVLNRQPGRIAAGTQPSVLATCQQQLIHLMASRLQRVQAELAASEKALDHLSPRRVLKRGYSITTIEGKQAPLKDAAMAAPGQVLVTTLASGMLRSVISGAKRRRVAPAPPDQPSLFENRASDRRVIAEAEDETGA